MKLTEYADIINCGLEITYHENQNTRWSATFKDSETLERFGGHILSSTYGNGNSPDTALIDYIHKITGKVLVINAFRKDKRREFKVPESLGAD